ncbi:hypothetical protein KF913_23485 [Candidatus Obscuribacterales bacterium]|nr:hypothetical protein [Candidatus Obscuribacterales bacterium]
MYDAKITSVEWRTLKTYFAHANYRYRIRPLSWRRRCMGRHWLQQPGSPSTAVSKTNVTKATVTAAMSVSQIKNGKSCPDGITEMKFH